MSGAGKPPKGPPRCAACGAEVPLGVITCKECAEILAKRHEGAAFNEKREGGD